MVEVFYRYRVHAAQALAFEHAYGQTGPWAKFYADCKGFRRTRLFRHKAELGIYVVVDVWDSKAAWDEFRSSHSETYARIDRELRMLYLEEHLMGYYEGTDDEEYRSSFDASA